MNNRKAPRIRFKGFTDDWEQRKLGEIVGIYDGVHQTPNYQNSGVMFLSVENIATLKSLKFISEEDFKRDYKVFPQEKDILMTRIGDVGTTNVVTDNGLKAYYVSLALLKYKSTDPYFLSNAIQSDYVQKGLANRTLKTAIPMKINKDEIGKVSVMLPLSATEQQQIGTYFRNLDHLITLHQRKLEKLKIVKKAMLENCFPKNGEKVPQFRFSGFTGDWEQRKLSDLVDVCSGRDYKHLYEGMIPVYGTGGYMLSVSEALSYDRDAIGIGRKGTIDKPYVLKAPFWTVDTLFYAVPEHPECLDFIHDVFQIIDWKKKDESTGVPSLSKEAINDTNVMVPKIDEQIIIGGFSARIDHLITLHQRKLEKLKIIKKSFLEKMFV